MLCKLAASARMPLEVSQTSKMNESFSIGIKKTSIYIFLNYFSHFFVSFPSLKKVCSNKRISRLLPVRLESNKSSWTIMKFHEHIKDDCVPAFLLCKIEHNSVFQPLDISNVGKVSTSNFSNDYSLILYNHVNI